MKTYAICNPNSKKFKKGILELENLGKIFSKHNNHNQLLVSKDPEESLYKIVSHCFDNNPDILIIAGGDGTVHQTLTQLINFYGNKKPLPYFILFPAGTINCSAVSLGYKNKISDLELLLENPTNLENELLLKIRMYEKSNDANILPKYGFLVAGGGISNFLYKYYDKKFGCFKEPSPQKAVELILRTISSFTVNGSLSKYIISKKKGEVYIDDVLKYEEYLLMVASSIQTNVISIKPFYSLASEDSHFHGVVAGDLSLTEIVVNLTKCLFGKELAAKSIILEEMNKLKISCDPQNFTIDGDMYSSVKGLQIEPGPEITFIKPK